MASKPSKSIPTSTVVRPDQVSQPQNTPTVQQNLNVKPTKPIPIPKPAHTSVAQVSVTGVANLTSASPTSRKMSSEEVARRCYEIASQEEKKSAPVPRRPTTLTVKPQQDDRQREMPQTSATNAGPTYTMTVSSNPGEVTTTTTTTKIADIPTSLPENINTSGKTMRRRIEQGLPSQAITLFAPIGMAEDLTKVQLILCKEIKTEIQEVKNLITTIPHEEIQRNFSNLAILLDERMTNLEDQYEELKKMVKQNSTQNYIANPALLEHWNPGDMVIRHSPWTTVRLVLNKVASENITELFPSDWHPRPMMSTDEEKQYKVITELMTHLFQQCGYLQEENIIELDNYQDFLKTLQHHVFMGNVSITQLIHFMILMVYMSFCRLNHYTEYMSSREAVLLKAAVHISLVIIAFKTTFSMRGGHHSINPYLKNLPPVVRRNLHVVNTRYLEQQCTCKNHVQCDIYPVPLTTEVVLPTYPHFLNVHNLFGTISRETNILGDYGKTIQMMILARVNGYYSPYFPSTIAQEEEQAETGHLFNLAEENFFRYRLQTLYPKIDEEGIKTAIGFLATQKLANCPCSVHTEERGYEWIVFRRQPDRKIYSTDDDDEQSSTSKSISDDDVFFSAEAGDAILDQRADVPEPTPECTGNLEEKSTPPDVLDEDKRPQMSTQLCESSLHSRENRDETSTGEPSTSRHQAHQKTKKKKSKKNKGDKKTGKTVDTTESPMSIDDDGQAEESDLPKKRKGFAYYPLLTYKRELDKTFYYKYFRPYSHDYRRLRMEEDCQCPHSEPHDTGCEWYDPNIIYILEAPDDISASEEAAQQKIYDLYMKSMNSSHHQTEYCGCGSAAEIAYMGHHTGCSEFQYVHERESYEVLLAMLKKKKKVSFPGCPFNKNKRPRLHSPQHEVPRSDDTDERPKCAKTPLAKLIQKVTEPAFDADSINPPEPPINPPEPLSDQIAKVNDGFVCPHDTNGETNGETNGDTNDEPEGQADEEMPPLVDETEV